MPINVKMDIFNVLMVAVYQKTFDAITMMIAEIIQMNMGAVSMRDSTMETFFLSFNYANIHVISPMICIYNLKSVVFMQIGEF